LGKESYDLRECTERLTRCVNELGAAFPKVLVVISAYRDAAALRAVLERIPVDLLPCLAEITIFDRFEHEAPEAILRAVRDLPAAEKLTCSRIPRPYDYGENLKNCFDYGLEKGFDYIAILRGDAAYDPACLPAFLVRAVTEKCPVVMGFRGAESRPITGNGLDWAKWEGNRLLSFIEELVLHMKIRDYHCGFRLISTEVLRRIPYSLNASDYLFDLQLLIQIRCLGVPICSIPVPDFHDPGMRIGQMAGYALRAVGMGIGYRLHQLHIVRSAAYFVDLGEHYTLKRNRYSSHMQILASLEPGSTVLDIGCGQSLLAEEYVARGIRVFGVDQIPPELVSPFVHRYVRHDLEVPLDLPFGRVFDYVILSDVIEHIKNRDALMESLRRYLKLDGKVVASTGNIAIWFYRTSLLLGRFEYGPRGILDRTHVYLFTLDSFRRFFLQRGYRVLGTRFTPIPFELVFSSTGRSALVEGITGLYQYLTSLWPRMFAYQFIVYCTFRSYESAQGEQTWQADGHEPLTDARMS
jgi:SAM-dependent methyltransferase